MEYKTLSAADRLLLARDMLRGRESDHFRISLTNEPNKEARLESYEVEIEELRHTVERLEAEVEGNITDPDSPIPDEELTPQQKAARTRKRNAAKKDKDGS